MTCEADLSALSKPAASADQTAYRVRAALEKHSTSDLTLAHSAKSTK